MTDNERRADQAWSTLKSSSEYDEATDLAVDLIHLITERENIAPEIALEKIVTRFAAERHTDTETTN